jgi:hypothetical protein
MRRARRRQRSVRTFPAKLAQKGLLEATARHAVKVQRTRLQRYNPADDRRQQTVLGVNSNPRLAMQMMPDTGQPRDVAAGLAPARLVTSDALPPDAGGRVPQVGIQTGGTYLSGRLYRHGRSAVADRPPQPVSRSSGLPGENSEYQRQEPQRRTRRQKSWPGGQYRICA